MSNRERVLITGVNGTIGKMLEAALRERGYEVYGCDVSHDADPNHMRADVANKRQIERVFAAVQPHYVYHLAAEFGRNNGEDYFEQVWTTNAIGTRNMMECCRDFDAHMFFASSSEVYGERVEYDYDGSILPLFESTTERTPKLTNEYAISKFTNELQIANFVERYETPITTLRFFNAYGPGERYSPYRSVVALFVYRALTGQPFDVYEGYNRTFMFIDDFVPTLANLCVAKPGVATINIGGNDFRSVDELADIVLAATGADRSLVNELSFEAHNVVSKQPDIHLAYELLGHDPKVKLEEGVPATVNWMRWAHNL